MSTTTTTESGQLAIRSDTSVSLIPTSQRQGLRVQTLPHDPNRVLVSVESWAGPVTTFTVDREQARIVVDYLAAWLDDGEE